MDPECKSGQKRIFKSWQRWHSEGEAAASQQPWQSADLNPGENVQKELKMRGQQGGPHSWLSYTSSANRNGHYARNLLCEGYERLPKTSEPI